MFRFALGLMILLASSLAFSQSEEDFHEFTDKNGKTIVAMLLGVSEDRRMMKIRRTDGQEFETEIVVLSLDDQQYIKDWLKNPPVRTDYRIEVSATRKSGDADVKERDSYNYEKKQNTYAVTIRNLSREPLVSAKVEYAVVWEDNVATYQTSEGTYTYRTLGDEGNALVKELGGKRLDVLEFNRDQEFETSPFEITKVTYTGNEVLAEDNLLGIIVRVIVGEDTLLEELHYGSVDKERYPWEMVKELPDPATYD